MAASLYHLGRFDEAILECRKNYDSGVALGDEFASGIIFDVWVRAAHGEIDMEAFGKELKRPHHNVQSVSQIHFARGLAELNLGKKSEAVEAFEDSTKIAKKSGIYNGYTIPAHSWLATALRKVAFDLPGHCAQQRIQLLNKAKRAARHAIRLGRICRNDLPRAWREIAIVYAAENDFKRSMKCLSKSIKVAREISSLFEQAKTLYSRYQILEAFGKKNWQQDLEEAQRLFTNLDSSVSRKLHQSKELLTKQVSLADQFDMVLACGRRIASALTVSRVYEEVQDAATKLLRTENCFLIHLPREGSLKSI